MQTFTRSYCRGEQREGRFRFAGYATEHAHENRVRPRAFYQSCTSCSHLILTLGGPRDVPDTLGLCHAMLMEFVRRRGNVTFDESNVLGDLYEYCWKLYGTWLPDFGKGTGTFRGYATTFLRKRVGKFVAQETGTPYGKRTIPKAHHSSVSTSFDALVFNHSADQTKPAAVGGLERFVAGGPEDSTGDSATSMGWMDTKRNRG